MRDAFLSLGPVGHLRPAPGTIASAITALALAVVHAWWPTEGPLSAGILVCAGACIFVCALLRIRRLPHSDGYDEGWIVIDEVLGMLVAALPLFVLVPFSWTGLFLAFALFRAFDILKPFGIRAIDRQETPSSVLLDDLLAGFYAAVMVVLLVPVLR